MLICYRPSVLDNFALLSGQLNSLGRVLKNEKVPALRNHLLLPIVLSPERDQELEVKSSLLVTLCMLGYFGKTFFVRR